MYINDEIYNTQMKKKIAIIKGFEKCNDDFDVKRTHRQITNYNHYFKSKKFIKIEI